MTKTTEPAQPNQNPAGARYGAEVLHDIEIGLSEPLFLGIPLGATLNDVVIITLINGDASWSLKDRWLDRARWIRYRVKPYRSHRELPQVPEGRILVTWTQSLSRFNDLLLPLVMHFGPQRCVVLHAKENVRSVLPVEVSSVSWADAMHYDRWAWESEFRRCWRQWKPRLRDICRADRLPRGAYQQLALHLMLSSQGIIGSLDFLRRIKPTAILTEYDRNSHWSCLILAAHALQIPTFTLMHGVTNAGALGFVPVLADRVFCWGDLDRQNLLAAGEDPAKLLIGGCPRLTRDLTVTPSQGRARVGLDDEKPVVMLGTSPIIPRDRLRLAEIFCEAASQLDDVSAAVRLHPSELLDFYADLMRRHPSVRFVTNAAATLDESLAAADLVVVHNSGLGSDALVKRRLVIVVDLPGAQLEHGKDLVEHAGCPLASDASALAAAIRQVLFDPSERQKRTVLAENYVQAFCSLFGPESTARIAGVVQTAVASGHHGV